MYIYLASPYSHEDEKVMQKRYEEAKGAVLVGLSCEVPIYSPIVHWHPASLTIGHANEGKRPITHYDFWIQNCGMIKACHELWILSIPGWAQSRGIAAEKRYAMDIGKSVWTIDPDELELSCTSTRKVLEQQVSSWSARLQGNKK